MYEVVYPERQLAKWSAIRYTSDHIFDYVELGKEYSIFEIEIPNEWDGKTVSAIDIRGRFGINIMAIRRDGRLDINITPDMVLTAGCHMLVLGSNKNIEKCFHI